MDRSKPKTAAEFMAELATDAEYQRRLAERQTAAAARGAAVAADERDLVAELQLAGVKASSVYDFIGEHLAPAAAGAILVRHLSVPHIREVREGVIRALSCSHLRPAAFDALKGGFRQTTDPSERWLFANALAAMATLEELKFEVAGISEYAGLFSKDSRA